MATEWVVENPKGVRYRVRIGRSGVARYNPTGGLPNLASWAGGLSRYLLRRDVRWSVEVVPVSPWHVFYDPVLLDECENRTAAERRATEILEAICAGELGWEGPWDRRSGG